MILITGASGQLASLVVARARETGLRVHTASRLSGANRRMDFDQVGTLDFDGISTLFLTSAGYAEDDIVIQRHASVLVAARAQGVRHVIYTSLSKASDHLGFALAHRWTERAIMESGMDWTILRNGLYAESIGALAAPRDGKITAPFGTAGISAVARADLAEAAAMVLSEPGAHAGACYELSGPVAFAVSDLAQRLGLTYEPTTLESERSRLSTLPLLPFQPAMIMSIYSAAVAGALKSDASDLPKLVPQFQDALTVASTVARQAA